MKSRSPTLEGFRAIFRHPSFGLAEVAWRWSFGAATGLLLVFSCSAYLDGLPVSTGDLPLLRSRQAALISRALLHIFRGSGFRVVEVAVVLLLALGIAWVVVASLARAATMKALLAYFRECGISTPERTEGNWRLRSLLGLNFFRLGTTVAAAVSFIAAVLVGKTVSRPTNPAPGSALLLTLTVVLMVWLVWSALNWFLSLAAVFVVGDGQDTFGAIAAAVDLCHTRPGSVFAAGTWFGLAHITTFVVATSVVGFPLAFAPVLPAGVILGGVLLVTLLYFAAADFLYAGRLAAYVAIAEMPQWPVSADPAPPPLPRAGTYVDPDAQSSPAVDASELILSDIPASS
jgi:hypothetical protein